MSFFIGWYLAVCHTTGAAQSPPYKWYEHDNSKGTVWIILKFGTHIGTDITLSWFSFQCQELKVKVTASEKKWWLWSFIYFFHFFKFWFLTTFSNLNPWNMVGRAPWWVQHNFRFCLNSVIYNFGKFLSIDQLFKIMDQSWSSHRQKKGFWHVWLWVTGHNCYLE